MKQKKEKIGIILSKSYKLAYCLIPKTGCSNMKRVMLALNGFGNNTQEIFPVRKSFWCLPVFTSAPMG